MSNDSSERAPGDNGVNRGGGGGGGAQPKIILMLVVVVMLLMVMVVQVDLTQETANFAYDGWIIQGNGYASIDYVGGNPVDTTVVRNTIVSGSTTKTLSLTSDQVGIQTVSWLELKQLGPLISTTANFVGQKHCRGVFCKY